MFRSNMSESNTKTIYIDNISPAVIEKMLQYIYSGKVALDEQAEQTTRELLMAANFFLFYLSLFFLNIWLFLEAKLLYDSLCH